MRSAPILRRALAAGAVGAVVVVGGGLAAPGAASAGMGPDVLVTPGDGNYPWTVPSAVCSVAIDLYGGHGGDLVGEGTVPGGAGGHVSATLQVTAGQHFLLQAGAQGATGNYGGASSGGDSGASPSGGDGGKESGAGGGASFVRAGFGTEGTALLVAGGGGGAGNDPAGGDAGSVGTSGGDSLTYAGHGGAGGSSSTPGAGGAATTPAPSYWATVSGGSAQGTLGGGAPTGAGGGGGGGYQGGGAGAGGTHTSAGTRVAAGGGGGANFVAGAAGLVSQVDETADSTVTDGSIGLTYTACPPVVAPGAPRAVQATADHAQVAVNWLAPNTGGPADHYVVTMSPGGQTCTTTHLSCLFGAAADTVYTATVAAYAADGSRGPSAHGTSTVVSTPSVPAEAPQTPLTLTTDKGLITTTTPGTQITVIGTGFLPHSTATVVIYSTPIVLGTVLTDAHGNFSKAVTVPASLAAGHHSLIASGVAPNGTDRFLRMNVTVAAKRTAAGELAYTGASVTLPAVLGGSLLAVGIVLLLVSRRRRGTAA